MPIKPSTPIETHHSRIPKWSKSDQDFWLDYFQSASDSVIAAIMEGSGDFAIYTDSLKEKLKAGIRLAAELADTAVEEALYRGWVQRSIRKKRARNG